MHARRMMNEEPPTSHQVNEEVLQIGRGEVDDNERPFYIESVMQVNTKKFRTKAMNYRSSLPMRLPTLKLQVCTNSCMKYSSRFWTKRSVAFHLKIKYVSSFIQKGEKGGMANAKMCTFLERNIVARTFPCLHKFTHRLTLVCKMTSWGVRTRVGSN